MVYMVRRLIKLVLRSEDETIQVSWQGNVLGDGKLAKALVFMHPGVGLVLQPQILILHLLQISPLLRLFHLQLVLLLDSLDTTTCGVSSVLERPAALFHPHNLIAGQATHL